jgi:hypothetical protein
VNKRYLKKPCCVFEFAAKTRLKIVSVLNPR